MIFYLIATLVHFFVGIVALFYTNDIIHFYFFGGIGFLWFIAGCIVEDLKVKK